MEVFEVKDDRKYCEFHNGRGHDTGDCVALKDELERLVRDRDLWYFFNRFVANRVRNDYHPQVGSSQKGHWQNRRRGVVLSKNHFYLSICKTFYY